jgi:hypothetical protein
MLDNYTLIVNYNGKNTIFSGSIDDIKRSMIEKGYDDKRLIFAGKEYNLETLIENIPSKADDDSELHLMIRDKLPMQNSTTVTSKIPPQIARRQTLREKLDELESDKNTLLHICCGLASQTYQGEDETYKGNYDIYEVFPDVLLPYYNKSKIKKIVILVINIDGRLQNEDLKRNIQKNAKRKIPGKSVEISFIQEELKKEPDFIEPLTTLLAKGTHVILSDYIKIHVNYGRDGGFNGNSKLNLYAFKGVQERFKDQLLLLNGCGSLGWERKPKPPPLAVVFDMKQIPKDDMKIVQDVFLTYVKICQGGVNHIDLVKSLVIKKMPFFPNITEIIAEEKKNKRRPWDYFKDVNHAKEVLLEHIPRLLIQLKDSEDSGGNLIIPEDKYVELKRLFMRRSQKRTKRKKKKKRTGKKRTGKKRTRKKQTRRKHR